MTVSKVLLSGVIALALVPAAAQAANASAPARAATVSPAAQSLSLATPLRAGAQTGKKSHVVGGLLIPLILAAATVTVVATQTNIFKNNDHSGS